MGGYVIFGYLVMEILFFAVWCRPFHNYWSVPAANAQCATYHDHLITNTVFNVSSDLMMLAIPLPILIRAKLPLRKKLILCIVFSMGIFVVICALLSKSYSFVHPYGVDWVYWYVREVSTAVIVANMPHLWALLRRTFNLRAFLSRDSTLRSRGTKLEGTAPRSTANQSSTDRQWFPLKNKRSNTDSFLTPSESEEDVTGAPMEIHKEVDFRVEHERASQYLGDPSGNHDIERLEPPGLHTGWQSKTTITSTNSAA